MPFKKHKKQKEINAFHVKENKSKKYATAIVEGIESIYKFSMVLIDIYDAEILSFLGCRSSLWY